MSAIASYGSALGVKYGGRAEEKKTRLREELNIDAATTEVSAYPTDAQVLGKPSRAILSGKRGVSFCSRLGE